MTQSPPSFTDITLYDQETGEPFIFSAKEQEFFWKQGFTNPPKFSPERRKQKRLERELQGGTPTYNVTCRICKKVGKVMIEPADMKEVLCESCFMTEWEAFSAAHPDKRAIYDTALAAFEAIREEKKARKAANQPAAGAAENSYSF
jgi:hypothetical protein